MKRKKTDPLTRVPITCLISNVSIRQLCQEYRENTLKGIEIAKEDIQKKQNEFIERKKVSQPSQIKTCGSTFKNLNNEKKAWQLIKETGCDQLTEGDATISKKHCNFFVNNGKAKSSDIEKLINKVQKTVSLKTGVNLELEIKIIGD